MVVSIRERREAVTQWTSTLEALAVMLSLKLFHGGARTPQDEDPVDAGLDGQSRRLSTQQTPGSKMPSRAALMEFAAYFKKRSIKASVEWFPRTANMEADALANGDTSGFKPDLAYSGGASLQKRLQWRKGQRMTSGPSRSG